MKILHHGRETANYREQKPQVTYMPGVTDPIRIAFAEVVLCLRVQDAEKVLMELGKAIEGATK